MNQPHQPPPTPIFQRLDQTRRYPYQFHEYFRRFAWAFVQALALRLSPPRAFRWRGMWLRLFGASLARTARVGRTTRVFHPWLLTIGHHSHLADGVFVYNLGPVVVGDHTVISQGAYLCAGTHDYTQPDLPLLRPPIHVGSGVWICAQAFVGPGVSIGDNSILGARAVALDDVPPGVVATGNPARVVKPRPMPYAQPTPASPPADPDCLTGQPR